MAADLGHVFFCTFRRGKQRGGFFFFCFFVFVAWGFVKRTGTSRGGRRGKFMRYGEEYHEQNEVRA